MYFYELNDDLDTCIFFEILSPFFNNFCSCSFILKILCYLYVLVPVRTHWEYINLFLKYIYLSFLQIFEDFELY